MVPFTPSAVADGTDEETGTIDMETDNDGNGIPDEFETEYRKFVASIKNMDTSSLDLQDVRQSEPYKALRGFHERLPMKSETKVALDQGALAFQEAANTDSPEKQRKQMEELAEIHKKLLEDDQVYMRAMQYIRAITKDLDQNERGTSKDDLNTRNDAYSGVRGAFDEGDRLPALEQGVASRLSTDEHTDPLYEGQFNRVGDIIFKDTGSSGFDHQYAMKWTHVGIYAGDGYAYDSDASGCTYQNVTGYDTGVDLRPLSRYYRTGNDIMYSQLANQSWRWTEGNALQDGIDAWGEDCVTPFGFSIFSGVDNTSFFYCSKLVYRIYMDNALYSVNVNSDAYPYYLWLHAKWGNWAWLIIWAIVSPDEVALDPDLVSYYTNSVP